jgi:hypothetical protein
MPQPKNRRNIETAKRRKSKKRFDWKRIGIHFESPEQMENLLHLAAQADTQCPVTAITNLNHKSRYGETLSLDHSHFSGRARGLVHRNINALVGWLERDEISLRDLYTFIQMWEQGFFKP